jgi:hypothetical protein
MRRGLFALAFVAVFSVLAQPVCAALESRLPAFHAAQASLPLDPGSGERMPCCAEVEPSVLALSSASVSAKTAAFAAQGAALPPGAAVLRTNAAPPAPPAPAIAAPPPPLSYYARSARILR